MKKVYSFILAVLFALPLLAQVPGKMSYQAVVRDNNNVLIVNSEIGLRISILQNDVSVYEEVLMPVTNDNGLITIEIGNGEDFRRINWAEGTYFIKTEIDPSGGFDYTISGVSQMLTVPYAMHALSAGYITEEVSRDNEPGVPSQNWSLFGNLRSNPDIDKLGTTDVADLVLVTNNLERMRIYSNGDIKMTGSLDVDANLVVDGTAWLHSTLEVDGAVDLNSTLNVDGETDLQSALRVNNQSPTLLTGTLEVDGETDLNDDLRVNNESPTLLTGTLEVNGETDLNNDLRVNNQSPTLLTGTLDVDGATNLNDILNVDGATDLNNTLNVDGETDLNNDLRVNNLSTTLLTGTLEVDGETDLNDDLRVNNLSPTLLTGTLNVNGATNLHDILNVDGATDLNNTLNVDGETDLNSAVRVNNLSPTLLTGTLEVNGATNLHDILNVDGATDLNNTLNVDGETDLNDDLRVNNLSTTLLTGTLEVDGETDLNDDLRVNNLSPTLLTGTLQVDGETDLNSAVRVNNQSPTLLTGTLNVNGATNLHDILNVDGATDLNNTLNVDGETDLNDALRVNNLSPTFLTGTLEVDGATDLNNSLNVDGPADFKGTIDVDGALHLKSTLTVDGATDLKNTLNVVGITDLNSALNVKNESPVSFSGTLGVVGATDLDNTLNVDGASTLKSSLNVDGASVMGSTLNVNGATNLHTTLGVGGATTLNNTLAVTGAASMNSTLNVAGATSLHTLNVSGPTNINNSTGLNGQVTITANLGGGESNYGAYPLRVQGSGQGIAVKLTAGTPNNSNNFMTFFNGSGDAVGRIEGETAADKASSPEYLYDNGILIAEEAVAVVNVVLAAIPIVVGGFIASAGPCLPCLAITAADLILATANLVAYNVFAFSNLGVTYQSGSADYAEWLERYNPGELISAGDIVGVYGGKVSKNTLNARQFLVISTNPAMLGNMPEPGREYLYEKVAFMGQIPVKVRGAVFSGDYILPSGYNDGTGIAVSPKDITTEQYREIVGVSWSNSLNGDGVSVINMAIGLNANDAANLAVEQETKLRKLEDQYYDLEQRLLAIETGTPYTPDKQAPATPQNEKKAATGQQQMSRAEFLQTYMTPELSDEVMEEAMLHIQNSYRDRGLDYKDHAGLNKLFTDATYRAEVIRKTQENYKKTYQSIIEAAK